MNELVNSTLCGAIARILELDMDGDVKGVRFACRPYAAQTAERSTCLGRFRGQIGLPAFEEFKAALEDLVEEHSLKIVLDFEAAALTKSAVGVLMAFAAAMHGRKKRLYLYRPSAQVRAVLKELGVRSFFSYLETEDDLIATLVV